jgi:DNA-binding NarL/FixJ family response regulator
VYDIKPILLIENDPAYSKKIICAIEDMNLQYPIVHLSKSEDVLNYLKSRKKKPWFILLGLNNQNKDFFHLLKIIKTDEKLKITPLVIFTDSHDDYDKVQSYEFGIAGYIIKSQNASDIADAIRIVLEYWTLSELPPDSIDLLQEFETSSF